MREFFFSSIFLNFNNTICLLLSYKDNKKFDWFFFSILILENQSNLYNAYIGYVDYVHYLHCRVSPHFK